MILSRILLLGAVAAACTRPESEQRTEPAASSSTDTARPWRKPGDKVDSILPMPEYLRRFRQGLNEPAWLTGGAASREALARQFLVAISARDTAALAALAVSRAEFAWLVFPDHIYARPPYELDPEIFWMQLTAESAKGAHRTLELYGGARLALLSMGCQRDTMQIKSGPVRIWSDCELRYRAGDSVLTGRLFGSIVERDGRMKLLSFANGG